MGLHLQSAGGRLACFEGLLVAHTCTQPVPSLQRSELYVSSDWALPTLGGKGEGDLDSRLLPACCWSREHPLSTSSVPRKQHGFHFLNCD